MLISDAAAVMVKKKLFKQLFPNVLHFICLAHTVHKICGFTRDQYPDVNILTNTYKKNY